MLISPLSLLGLLFSENDGGFGAAPIETRIVFAAHGPGSTEIPANDGTGVG
jgi:hypothetical protein